MPSRMREDRQRDAMATPRESRFFLTALGIAALIGLVIGVIWVIAGLLNFHVLR